MADKNLNINIIAKDKSKQALGKVQSNLDKTRSAVFNLKTALIGIGAGAILKSFISVGAEVQNLQVRFKFLFGSAEEGAKAFDNLSKFAGTVPFSLENIAAASGNLGVVAKDAKDLTRILEITGNVAAFTGLDFETTASQIQRSFAGGIAAADIFREKGLRSILGFEAGAKVSVEETIKAFEDTFGKGGKLGNVTGDLANTLVGQASMVQDKFFNFQKIVSDQFIGSLTSEIKQLNTILEDNEKVVNDVAIAIGTTLKKSLETALIAVQLLTEGIIALTETKQAIEEFLPFGLKLQEIFQARFLTAFIRNLDEVNNSISEATEQLRLFRDAEFLSRKELEKYREELAKTNSGFKEFAKNAKDTMELTSTFKITPITEGEDIFEQLKNIREKTGVGLINQIKRQRKQELIILEEANKLNLLSEEEYLKQKEKLNEMFEKRLIQAKENEVSNRIRLEQQAQKEIISLTGNALKDLSQINLTAFRAYQAFQIGQAIINAHATASRVFAQYAGLFPLNYGLAAAAYAAGAARVAAIRNAPAPRQTGGAVVAGQQYMVGEAGKELFRPSTNGTIVPNDQLGGGSTTVNFNITTVDAKGFNELLTNSRGTIVGMINSAVNEQGRASLV